MQMKIVWYFPAEFPLLIVPCIVWVVKKEGSKVSKAWSFGGSSKRKIVHDKKHKLPAQTALNGTVIVIFTY